MAAALQLLQVLVGPLDLVDKPEVVRQALARHGKQLDEDPFNNQVGGVT